MTGTDVFAPGSTALITGAASGIGLAIAKLCRSKGMKVLLADRNAEALDKAVKEVAGADGSSPDVLGKALDVSNLSEWEQLRDSVKSSGSIELLVLNAGTGVPGSWGNENHFRATLETNLFGVIHGINTFLPLVQEAAKSKQTAIVITGSKQGITNPPGNPAYNASKAAVKSLTEQLSYDLRGTKTSVHLLVPGWTYTTMTGSGQGKEKPAGPWLPEQVATYLYDRMAEDKFYVICPDNDVSEQMDKRRILWSAGDITEGRPPLSRWREEWKQKAEETMANTKVSTLNPIQTKVDGTASEQRLCPRCQTVTLSRITKAGFSFHLNFRQLSLAASDLRDGCCDLCFTLWWSLRWHSSKIGGELDDTDVVLYRNPPNDDPIQRIEVVVAPEERRRDFSWSADANGLHHIGPPDEKPWIARGHLKVFATNKDGYSTEGQDEATGKVLLASREFWVIDVGIPGAIDEARLIHAAKAQRGAYLALSYCWGQEPFFHLNSDNRTDLEQSLPLEKLPRTVQDAVTLTRRLGVRYLWVDSLCITQGSDQEALDEWEEQSRNMNMVFGGAFLTILASRAAGAHEGVFADRAAPTSVSCTIPVVVGAREMVHLLSDVEAMHVSPEPLEQRAWAYQEEFLSLRTLSFGSKELTWRCRGSKHRECDSESTFQILPKDSQAFRIHENWCSMVEEYSGKGLSIPTDKLPAVSGLANLVQAHLPPLYFSGVWEDRVVEQLLWRHTGKIAEDQRQYKRLPNDQVPSWSWASVEGKVEFLQGADPAYCKVLSLSDHCVVARAHVQATTTIRLAATANYFGGYDNYLPWATFPASMKTYLDDPDAIPDHHRRAADDNTEQLIDVALMFLGPNCGLILLRERGPARASSQGYRYMARRAGGRAGGEALRYSLEFPVRRAYKRIGSFVGFGHGVRLQDRPRRISSTTVHLI
ncbi:laccase precursor [Paramyrothecium foliicola]|nr:laccase precursor [Paramyrothecium foliicola]